MLRLMLMDEQWLKLRVILRENGIYDKPNLISAELKKHFNNPTLDTRQIKLTRTVLATTSKNGLHQWGWRHIRRKMALAGKMKVLSATLLSVKTHRLAV